MRMTQGTDITGIDPVIEYAARIVVFPEQILEAHLCGEAVLGILLLITDDDNPPRKQNVQTLFLLLNL